jgi:uncharacterized membrane protein YhaH (DUF805 family)
MEQPSIWQMVLYGVLALLVILWFRPGIKVAVERSKQAPKDWPAVLIPIVLVVAFVVFLIVMT